MGNWATDPGVLAIVGLCALLALWYGVGYWVNRRRGERLFRWLELGLDGLGGEQEKGWIGSPASGARITVVHASPPFRRLEITLLLENREIPLLWLADRLRGRGDRLVIKATLRSPRQGQIEVGSGRRKAARRREQPWTWEEGPHGLAVAYQGRGAKKQLLAWRTWLESYGAYLRRLSCHKTDPHIQLQINLAGLTAVPSEVFLADLQAAAGGALPAEE